MINLHESLKKAVAANSNADGLDILFADIDDMCIGGEFKAIDTFLGEADILNVKPTLLIGILAITLSASECLPNRISFYKRVEEQFNKDQLNTARLLNGLGN